MGHIDDSDSNTYVFARAPRTFRVYGKREAVNVRDVWLSARLASCRIYLCIYIG